jgi:hypothetical protein
MANPVYIESVYKPESNLWGFHAYDSYASCSAFNWETLPDSDTDFLYDILTNEYGYPEELKDMLVFQKENDKGITIRDTYYEWEEISETYEKAMDYLKTKSS